MSSSLHIPLHVKYIQSLGENKDDLTYHLTAHLRLNAVYWGLTALCIMRRKDALDRDDTIAFVMSCYDPHTGGFGAHPEHDAHVLPTLSAIQILAMHDALDALDVPRVTQYILSLQTPSGVFAGDHTGTETDTRFTYCAVSALSLLGVLRPRPRFTRETGKTGETGEDSDSGPCGRAFVERTVRYIKRCRNFDGGFGACVGAESHAAQVFVCVAALAILGRLDDVLDDDDHNDHIDDDTAPSRQEKGKERERNKEKEREREREREREKEKVVDREMLGWWLAERQVPSGGLNGRPEKLEDVCYSWWVLSSLAILGRVRWVDGERLERFILSAEDTENGGIADRPGDQPDVFHTLFGVAGLSLLGHPSLDDVDPVYCMPARTIERMGLRTGWVALPRRGGAS